MPQAPPHLVLAYARALTGRLHELLGNDLVAVYLHGSAVLGGFRPDRSDVDVLAVVAAPVGRPVLEQVAAAVDHGRLAVPAAGLELDLIAIETAQHPRHPSPFELNLTTDPDGSSAVFGDDHGPSVDVTLHLAVTRAAGCALAGPPAADMIGDIPRAWLLADLLAELNWAEANGSSAYQALNASRAWRFAETGAICSKLDGARWALGRGFDGVLHESIAFQAGRTDRAPDGRAAGALLERARAALRAAAGDS